MLIKKPKPFLPYIRRRVQRIYPTFFVVLLVYLVLSFAFPTESKLPNAYVDVLIYITQNLLLLPGLFDIIPIITVAWSLSYELFFYLIVPFFISFLLLRRWANQYRILLLCLVTIFGFMYFWFESGHIRLLMFVAGMLLYEVLGKSKISLLPLTGIVALIVGLPIISVFTFLEISEWFKFIWLYVIFFLLCLDCFSSPGTTAKVFSFAPLRWYGNISYSYYLIHGLTLKGFFVAFAEVHPADGSSTWVFTTLFVPAFVLTIIVSTILFIVIEKPYSLIRK